MGVDIPIRSFHPPNHPCNEEHMKTTHKFLLAVLTTASLFGAAQAQTPAQIVVDGKGVMPYAVSATGILERSGFGLCWRTAYWTKELAR